LRKRGSLDYPDPITFQDSLIRNLAAALASINVAAPASRRPSTFRNQTQPAGPALGGLFCVTTCAVFWACPARRSQL
jgi:hypothetical protein